MKNPISSVASVLAAVMSFTPIYSLTALAYTVPACGWIEVTGPDGVCRDIYDNNCGNTMYVTDHSVAEWQNFYNNPNNATVVACGTGTGTGTGGGG